MGTKLKDITVKQEIDIPSLKNKSLVVDSYNVLYQFLSTIRMRDGSLLTDSEGNVTSHLVGLLSRTTYLMDKGLKLAFVFDGKPPALKTAERKRRKEAKIKAQEEYEVAKERGDMETMKKFASRTTVLTKDMVEEAKKLVAALGLPVVQAPSEGEAQAAYMVNQGDIYAEVSQDYDALLFGVPRLVRNLTITERKKMPSKLSYATVKPELIVLKDNLNHLEITQEQLIAMGILIGTDYNIGGIKGIGPKNALKLVKKYGEDFDELFKEAKWKEHFEMEWQEVFDTIKNIPTSDDYNLEWKGPDEKALYKLLCEEHEFAQERVDNIIKKLTKEQAKQKQKGLGDFF